MQQSQNYIVNKIGGNSGSLNIRAEVEKYLRYWKWFVLGVILSVACAYLYLRYSTPEFSATASILIKDNKKAGLSAELEAFKDLGIVGGGSLNNTDNEIEILKSRKVIGNVVDTLGLDIYYFVSGRVIESEVYKRTSPISIQFIDKSPFLKRKDTLFNVKIENSTSFSFTDIEGKTVSKHVFGELITNNLGTFKILANDLKTNNYDNVIVKMFPTYSVIDSYRRRINIFPVNKNSSVLTLSLQDPVSQKAEDVLNELVRQYNLDAINDKNQVAEKTIEFINARLDTVGKFLSILQDRVKEFKIDKEFTGIPVEVQLVLETLKENNQVIIEVQTQLDLTKWITSKLIDQETKYDQIPSTLGIENQSLVLSIEKYNQLISERNRTSLTAGPKNPKMIILEQNVEDNRLNLINSINSLNSALKLRRDELKNEESKIISRIKSFSVNERGYVDIAREKEIFSEIYQYLLKKKEETDISLAVTVPNAKIIDTAYSSGAPVSPKKNIVYLVALLLGLIVPFGIIYFIDILDTKVHNKQDIEAELSVPFLGDVPKSDSKEKVIIGNDVRSSTAEAFRLIRTNLDFMLTSNRKQSKAIFVTSTTSGEGKSFISINLAATLALSGKKVLLMGMDLRAPKVTEYLGIPERKGVTNYITDEDMVLEDLIFSIPQIKGLDIIASGVIPPNPAELLMTKRVDNLFTIVKQEYDIVLVDTAPVNLVTDTLLIGKYADMFMYVVRANYLDKRLLAVPQELYNEKKLPNMAIVLNDTDPKRSYGYGYGGYGYGYVVVEKPWYKKIFSRS